jgi:transcriptional regulator with GAF, ATPase, and Fis domain
VPYQLSLRHAMERSAREIGERRDLPTTLHTIVDVARRSLPGIDHVGVTLVHSGGRLETMAATGELVRNLDDLQYALAEGPCIHAIRNDPVVVVEHARREQRWPRYIPAARRGGLRCQVGLRLFVDPDKSLGSLNLYSTTSDTIPPQTRELVKPFTAHIAVVLNHVLLEKALSATLPSRTFIGTAVGIVMERYRLDHEQAFAYLARVSQHSNLTLTDVARGVVVAARDKSHHANLGRVRADFRDADPHRRQSA